MSCYFIWGLGFLGTSLARDLRKQGHLVGGCVIEKKAQEYLKDKLGFEHVFLTSEVTKLNAFLHQSELVCVATPVSTTIEILGDLSRLSANPPFVVTDMGSTKSEIMMAARKLFPKLKFTGSHPMAGSELSGPENSREGLFQGSTVYLTRGLYPEADEKVRQFWQMLGCQTVFISEKDHDRQLAYLSHGLHLLSCAVVHLLGDHIPEVLDSPYPPAGGSFRDMTRVSLSNPSLWDAILRSNKQEVVDYLQNLEKLLSNWRDKLERQELDIVGIFEKAREIRQRVVRQIYEPPA
ncbi:MAG: prephenate dehydrogenase/arogenate dehydrogenase family protein [Leptospiraceae bacterium]|nr:prephenate dehydrogenase/arogenate dehydrogenase family protein [Leptospiraceae bacterium]